jgi:hypothetical protein
MAGEKRPTLAREKKGSIKTEKNWPVRFISFLHRAPSAHSRPGLSFDQNAALRPSGMQASMVGISVGRVLVAIRCSE